MQLFNTGIKSMSTSPSTIDSRGTQRHRLDLTTIIGLVCGIIVILAAIMMGGKSCLFWSVPAIVITVCGSLSALLVTFGIDQIRDVFVITRHVFLTGSWNVNELIEMFVEMARRARREGLLTLEEDIPQLNDSFLKKGVGMMVDAIEPEVIRQVLETDMRYTYRRHELGQRVYRTWAKLAPAFGMIGTLISLIQMLAQIEDPGKLGPGMAAALITTFYGAIMANLFFNPMAGKLAIRSEEEMLIKELMLEGVTSIQAGMNPQVLEEKLRSYLAPDQKNDKPTIVIGRSKQDGLNVHV